MANILVSFSGGKTSAYMAKRMKDDNKNDNLFFVFANTGQESEETLIFVDKCDRAFNLGVVWVEAVVHEKGKGTTHKIVNFETASRDGEPFEAVMEKYGISNKAYPHCTRELKMAPIHTWAKEVIGNGYLTAIGIRVDEYRRVGSNDKIIYPLVDWAVGKGEVNQFWAYQPFTLNLLEHQGNCTWCWKKSLRKHFLLMDESPEIFDFPMEMESKYKHIGCSEGTTRVFFRQNRSTQDMLKLKQLSERNK